MSYTLVIADKAFSSWSLRAGMMFAHFNLPHREVLARLYTGDKKAELAAYAPAHFVPIIVTPEGELLGETLAIAETLAERHPEKQMWPKDSAARMFARWLCCEISTGFKALRDCDVQLLRVWEGTEITPALSADLARLDAMLGRAWDRWGRDDSPWLFGEFSIADAFYAPVCARIVGYDLPVTPRVQAYVAAWMRDPAFRAWRAQALTFSYDPLPYARDLPAHDWPEV
ncbi:hypothetical protein AQS8620_02329 [Aquimixticola soesokkakensis]|uniref:GST N-terminal domain-containing protein n=1 Tax=Aquimixticola soesokkakensis TaxID=1519096 RepID=A0A1Y5T3B1_9RHOB|nr:glutathione S-transferase N-terminal domain-containing protein [Aquimixticola soesokkakensis]SLN53226.1 hypothetical protein AQS8620_02329 [Aquimixticola soesokkakensis]